LNHIMSLFDNIFNSLRFINGKVIHYKDTLPGDLAQQMLDEGEELRGIIRSFNKLKMSQSCSVINCRQ
jgi:hypothetical protein